MVAMESLLAVAASAVLALMLGWAIHRRLGFVTEVESVSMAPTLVPGQRLLARRPGARGRLRRGDIVVVESAELGRPIIKRVVGLPGSCGGIMPVRSGCMPVKKALRPAVQLSSA